jgi:BACON domain-containing protein/all-beta uncharacterized protein
MRNGKVSQRRLTFPAITAILACWVAASSCGSSSNTITSPSTLSKCAVAVDVPGSTVPASGGGGTINIQTERECQWAAQPEVAWLSITAGSSGQGPGAVQFSVAANADPTTRTGGVMVNGQRAQVSQAAGECRFELSSNATSLPQSGGSGSVDVRASSALCTWTAASDVSWISINSNANGKGSAAVTFTVAATTGPPRTGTLTIAGQHFSVTQSEGCNYTVTPSTDSVGASGGTRTVSITSSAGCPWTAASNADWITVTSGANGTGSGTVTLNVASLNGPSRSGTVTVAGQMVTITQGDGCTFAISPDSQSVASSGGTGSVTVTAGAGCAWTATSGQSWITITSGANGNGNGAVNFTVASTDGPGRSGTMTIAGHTFTVNQGQGCSFSLATTSASAPAGGASGSFDVKTAGGCGWAANSNANWLSITAGATGSGDGTVRYTAAANTGPQRTGTITAGGQTFTVNQAAGCSYSISPASQNVASGGSTVSVAVTAPGGCSWTSVSNAPWITISSGSSGSGNGTVQLSVAANGDAERRGTVTIAGQTYTVIQGSGCAFSLSPTSQTVPAAGGAASFAVNTSLSCAWTAVASAGWISITSGASGNGPGTVQFSAAQNSGAARSGTITAAGQTFTVSQESGCSAVVAPDTIAAPAAGASQPVNISTSADCAWTAVSNAPWISVAMPASGSGNGTVRIDVQANTDAARSGTATIAGKVVTVNQDSGCTISLTPTSTPMPVGGGTGQVAVTAGVGCTWTAVSGAPWIIVTGGANGSGPGTVTFSVDANVTGATRSGPITIGTQTFTVNQAGQ